MYFFAVHNKFHIFSESVMKNKWPFGTCEALWGFTLAELFFIRQTNSCFMVHFKGEGDDGGWRGVAASKGIELRGRSTKLSSKVPEEVEYIVM
jgi:hypothetical protein